MENEFFLGAFDSGIDLRDYSFDMVIKSREKVELPESFCLDWKYPILSQGSVGSCVAHAISETKSFIDGVNIADFYSIGFIYGNRKEDDLQEEGMVTREALSNLVEFGDCYKREFPVNERYPEILKYMEKYNKEALYESASKHKSTAYIRLSEDEIKEYLFIQQKPIIIAVNVFENFYNANKNKGIIPSEPMGERRGGHAMVIIGYDKDNLIIVNSWGDYNGDKGKYYLDINSPIIRELWALEDKKQIMKPEPVEESKYKIGWNKDNKGWWYSPDGENYYKDSWQKIKDLWYLFDDEGYAVQNKWILHNESWYFLQPDLCSMATNKWILWKDKWYYVNAEGVMQTGWLYIGSKWYYLSEDGSMVRGVNVLIEGKYYTFDPSGAWVK